MTKDKLYTICKGIYDWLSTISKVQEESLTDWLVYQITKNSALSTRKMICKTFSKPVEGKKTGADIELGYYRVVEITLIECIWTKL